MFDETTERRIARYLTGESSAEEAADLQAWMAEDEGRARYVEELRQGWVAAGRLTERYDSARAWNAVRERIAARQLRREEDAVDWPQVRNFAPGSVVDSIQNKERQIMTKTEVAVLAGGCFWGVEEILRAVPGVTDTDVGYTGGWLENPTYHDTHDSKSGHAEAIRVTFDPAVLSYEELLEKWFFRLHDPTTLNRQGNDLGTQYRSAIFPQSQEQQATAERVKARVDASGKWKRPISTSIEPAATWYSAEGYHQDYLRKNPGGYSCHYLRD